MFDAYGDWGNDIKTVLSHIKEPSKWSMHVADPLEHYVKERVVLVGDAVRDTIVF